jgi:hypothetical protein
MMLCHSHGKFEHQTLREGRRHISMLFVTTTAFVGDQGILATQDEHEYDLSWHEEVLKR